MNASRNTDRNGAGVVRTADTVSASSNAAAANTAQAPARPVPGSSAEVWRRLPLLLFAAALLIAAVAGLVTAQSLGKAEPGPRADDPDALIGRIARLEAALASAEREQQRLARENARLHEQLGKPDKLTEMSRQIDAQAALLARVAEKLAVDTTAAADSVVQGAQVAALVDENARLKAELDVAGRRLRLLIDQFAAAHTLRLEALAEATAARQSNAELDARLQQRRQAAEEALMRADKAEKLNAALEEAQVRVNTENERLSRDLATARERQAEVLRQVVELDSRLADKEARAAQTTTPTDVETPPASTGGAPSAVDTSAPAPTDAAKADVVIYRVRADDTLSGISTKVYGNSSGWTRIFDANRDLLETPDDLAPGMALIIP